jgi:hypothetical protein
MFGGVQTIVDLLARGRFPLSSEKECQAEIEVWLRDGLPEVEILREHRLSDRDRPDFFVTVGGVAIEVKIGGRGQSRTGIVRQLARYAEHDQVEAIILATGVSILPFRLSKPVHFVSLGRAWL